MLVNKPKQSFVEVHPERSHGDGFPRAKVAEKDAEKKHQSDDRSVAESYVLLVTFRQDLQSYVLLLESKQINPNCKTQGQWGIWIHLRCVGHCQSETLEIMMIQ